MREGPVAAAPLAPEMKGEKNGREKTRCTTQQKKTQMHPSVGTINCGKKRLSIWNMLAVLDAVDKTQGK